MEYVAEEEFEESDLSDLEVRCLFYRPKDLNAIKTEGFTSNRGQIGSFSIVYP